MITQEITKNTIKIDAPYQEGYDFILNDEALAFIEALHINFEERRKEILAERIKVQEAINQGWTPDFDSTTADIRNSTWKVAPLPKDLEDRRVEITGPTDRKMMINALNSGAKVFMADLEDSNSPNWDNNIQGQINLYDAVRKNIAYQNTENGKTYTLNAQTSVLMVRPRGWHLVEKHLKINDESVSGSLLDFGLYFFHNAKALIERGTGAYFYLPKLENYKEAALWNDVFVFAQNYCNIPQGSIKATVLIETILAPFQLHEIIWALKEHIAGLNCGRWDYIFSFIKKFRNIPTYVFPDRSQITMTVPCMRAYTQAVIKTCHQRGAFAMGGMAAQIPIKNDEKANEEAMGKVKADKLREVKDGHDGTWVAHPALVPIALEIFDREMLTPNQLHILREDFECEAKDLLALPQGTITENGLRSNINIGILYIESWLRGNGAAAIYNLMEDAATAEISRTQVWQWLKKEAILENGKTVNIALIELIIKEEMEKIASYTGEVNFAKGRFEEALQLFKELITQDNFEDFLTIKAYNLI